MTFQKPKFIEGNFYHIYNRGVEKRNVFLDAADRFRFVRCLVEFNDERTIADAICHRNVGEDRRLEYSLHRRKSENPLVKILAFCLMPNHFHLLLEQIKENGIVAFMQKLGTGYTMYFNKRHERVGHLFQGRFKATHAQDYAHLSHLPFYIHCNPLGSKFPEWRNCSDNDAFHLEKALAFLESYRWSSYLDYVGHDNFPEVLDKEFLTELIGGPERFKEEVIRWLKEKKGGLDSLEELAYKRR